CTIEADGAIRLGLRYVNGLREQVGRTIAGASHLFCTGAGGGAPAPVQERQAGGGKWEPIDGERGANSDSNACPLKPMTEAERLVADYAGMGLTAGRHPMALRREELATRGILRARDLLTARQGRRVRVAGMVITRQRPGTAKGFVFLTLEDETGIANIIVRPDLFARDRLVIV